MKAFIIVCLAGLLALAESQAGCNGRECAPEQCCLSGMITRCVPLTREGGSCNNMNSCGCAEGLECRGMLWMQRCVRNNITSSTAPSVTFPNTDPTIPTLETTTSGTVAEV